VKLPRQSPDLNAYAERFVRTIKESCLEQLVLFGERSLRSAVHEFTQHYKYCPSKIFRNRVLRGNSIRWGFVPERF